jgi:hypothetical protein
MRAGTFGLHRTETFALANTAKAPRSERASPLMPSGTVVEANLAADLR